MVGRAVYRFQNRVLHDIDTELQRQAVTRTAAFIEEHMPDARAVRGSTGRASRFALLDLALDLAPADGLAVEFGVASGQTLRHIAGRRSDVHGFDSFEGLPEQWRPGFEAGHFAQQVPDVPGAELHVGWFDDTLPTFLAAHDGPIAFAHLDADLYSSTDTVLRLIEDRLVPGSILLFDEYFNVPFWERHEHRAFVELRERVSLTFTYVAFNALGEGVAVRVDG